MHLQRTMLRQSNVDPAASQNNARRATGTQPEAYIRAGLNSATVVDLLQTQHKHHESTIKPVVGAHEARQWTYGSCRVECRRAQQLHLQPLGAGCPSPNPRPTASASACEHNARRS
jgi:hypothetical protein